MNRPYIFCHMMTSLDGKIMGSYMNTKEGENAGNVFYNISFGENPYYKHQGWLSGRVTTDDNFTFYEKPALDENAPVVPEGDFVANGNAGMYYVSVDPAGKLGWKSGKLTYVDTHAHVIEVLTGKASNSYKAFLRKLGISYIVAGVETLDYEMAIVLRGQKPLALCDRCPCFGSLFPPLAALTFAASSIVCAFGLAAAAPRSPYRHLNYAVLPYPTQELSAG